MIGRRPARDWTALLLGLWLITVSQAAMAHVGLQQARPGPGDVLARPPDEIALTFDGMLAEGEITLFSTGFVPIDVATTQFDDKTLRAALPELPDGRYTVQWNVVAADGDPSSGSYDFVVDRSQGGFGVLWRWLVTALVALLLAAGGWVLRRRNR